MIYRPIITPKCHRFLRLPQLRLLLTLPFSCTCQCNLLMSPSLCLSSSISPSLTGGRPQPWWCRNNRNAGGGQNRSPISIKHSADSIRRPTSNSGVWTWLGGSRRSSAGPDQICPPSTSPAENHYTHMDDAYSPVGVSEALYAELDRESVRSANPSYQNTAYSQCGEVSSP